MISESDSMMNDADNMMSKLSDTMNSSDNTVNGSNNMANDSNMVSESESVPSRLGSALDLLDSVADVCVHLTVRVQVDSGQGVYVVGSCPQLGSWRSHNAVPLRQVVSGNEDGWNEESDNWSVWECQVWLPKDSAVDFRYFLGKLVTKVSVTDTVDKQDLDLEVIVWETNIHPRHIKTASSNVDEMHLPLAEFGNYDGAHTTSTGWLENHACVQIRFHGNPIVMWKPKYRIQKYSIKCSPVDYEPGMTTDNDKMDDSVTSFTEESSMDGPPPCTKTMVLYYTLNGNVCPNINLNELRPKPQPPKGVVYNPDDYLVFMARGINQSHLGFQLDFYVHTKRAEPLLVGSAHLLPPKKELSVFSKPVPIIGLNHRPIGEVQVESLRITPLPNYDWLMDVSYQNHWKWRKAGVTLNVGHRGMGSSYKRVTTAKENTIRSLHSAARHGADFVELDVMLSKDKVPVIYHDFSVCLFTPLKSKNGQGGRLVEVAIKDLTVEQLSCMKIFHSESSRHDDKLIEITERQQQGDMEDEVDDNDDQPFPSLQSCLEKVDPQVGFNIEIKFPQELETGECEQDNFFDMNFFVDTVLDVVLKFAGERKIILSTFHADVCIMVGLKQNKYPVLFLSNGPTQRYTPYKDWRCSNFQHGINFTKAEGLLGVNFQAEGLLKDLALVPYIQSLGLVLFVWGEDLNEDHVKTTLRNLNVDAIIFDRIGQSQHEQFTISPTMPSLQEVISKAAHVTSTNSQADVQTSSQPATEPDAASSAM